MNHIGEFASVRAMGTKPVANVPDISQISCLGAQTEGQTGSGMPSDAVSQRAHGGDWFKDFSETNEAQQQRSNIRDTDSEFVRLSKQGGHEGLLKMGAGPEESPFARDTCGDKDRASPSRFAPAGVPHVNSNVAPGNPIWLGGSGPEQGFVPGKRFKKHEHKESPFALSADWNSTQSRNPDKI